MWAAPWAVAALPFMAMPVIASGYAYGLGDVRIPNWINFAIAGVTLAFVGTGLFVEGRDAYFAIVMWLVANAVTVAAETRLAGWHGAHGGRLTRIAVAEAEPLGGGHAWRPLIPVTQLCLTKART